MDSSGLDESRRSGYYLWRLKKRIRRRDFRKFHLVSDCRLPEKVIYAWRLTSPKKGDSPLFVELVGKVPGRLGPVCGDTAYCSRPNAPLPRYASDKRLKDTAYCSRPNAQFVADQGGRPFLKPRKDSTTLAKGYPAYRRMVLHYKRKRNGFERVYHERSKGEATNSSFKRLWGSRLYSRKRWNQNREVGLKVVCHNLCLFLRFQIRLRLEKEVS